MYQYVAVMKKTSFYSSVSYKKVNATTPNNTFERYAFLVKGSHKISDRVDVAASVSFANLSHAMLLVP